VRPLPATTAAMLTSALMLIFCVAWAVVQT
jgi:hypothetical protein